MRRGEVWWAELSEPVVSEPGYRRPVFIVQSDDFNSSRIRTVIAVVLTTNLHLAEAPGNVPVSKEDAALPTDSVANVSQIITLDKTFLKERVSRVSDRIMMSVEDGIRTVIALYNTDRRGWGVHRMPARRAGGASDEASRYELPHYREQGGTAPP
ncbi:MAG TPA: type II toxin-antitoxin system PemK/MazF family toxin [Rubrobacter sp.]